MTPGRVDIEPGLRERAAELRSRAAAIEAELDAQDRALQARREANEARGLEAQAAELEREQDAADKAIELRAQGDAVEAAAGEHELRVRELNVEMFEAAIRAARFERQIAIEVTARRPDLEQRSVDAAAAGDTEAVLAAERDLALLPTLETRLRVEFDTASARVGELNSETGKAEAWAEELRMSAVAFRRWADVDPLAAIEPPAELPRGNLAPRLSATGGLGSALRRCRAEALQAMQRADGFHEQDAAVVADEFGRTVASLRAAVVGNAHAERVVKLTAIAALVGPVREAATADASPTGALRWFVPRGPMAPTPPRLFPPACAALAEALGVYSSLGGGYEMPACSRLSEETNFDLLPEVVDAAALADDEVARERLALDAAIETYNRLADR